MSGSRYDEEIDLREFIQIIIKRGKNIFFVFFFVLAVSLVVTLVMPKKYEVKAVIQNGYLNDDPILKYDESVVILQSNELLSQVLKKLDINNISYENIKKVIFIEDIKNTNYFNIKIVMKDKKTAYLLIQEIINSYIIYGQSIYGNRISLMKNQINQFEDLIDKTQIFTNKAQNTTIPLTYPDHKVQLRDLISQKYQLEYQLSRAKEFKVINEPIMPEFAIFPRIRINIIIGGILGLIFGVFFAFHLESKERLKK